MDTKLQTKSKKSPLSNLFKLDPLMERRFFRFKQIKRAYWSFWIIFGFLIVSLFAELFINNRAIMVSYKGKLYFPIYSKTYLGTDFGYDYKSEVNYKHLQKRLKETGEGWVLLPIVPYNAYEQDLESSVITDDPTGRTFIGTSLDHDKPEESDNPKDYVWSRPESPEGIALPANAEETESYLWIKFASNDKAEEFPSDNISKDNPYIGIKFSPDAEEGMDPAEYTWKKYESRNGIEYTDASGNIKYLWIKFADNESGLVLPPTPPSAKAKHFFGTDRIGRDVLARLVYGFRIAILFSLALNFVTYIIGVLIGVLMGYWGGPFDMILQRFIEIWELIPSLYIIMILSSIFRPNFFMFLLIFIIFGWTAKTWSVRAMTYRERERDYILAAKSMGASTWRIATTHIIPNIIVVILTSLPFAITGGISFLTSLDYLGLGLPPPTPSWGELLSVGTSTFLTAPWILTSVVTAMVLVLVMITFIGEGLREAFDPKRYTVYK